ncbi:MAG: helix-turn-helix transcriptional regulator [Clostridia bacterium]|nr:helix-turn-helix transcriptional regulator [Clostridia bacterium]
MKNKFGERLNELLKAENISQKDFAKAICVSQSIVCDWLKGRVQPTADNILNTADFFKVTTDYILGKDIFY